MGKDNPLFHLLPPSKAKYHQIVKFVHFRGEEEDDEVFGEGKRRVVIRGQRKSRKLHDAMVWGKCEDNVGTVERRLNATSIPDYLAYTAKVSDLAEIYQWPSVLEYDDLYRQMQSQSGYRWGTESPHLQRICLRFKERKTTVQNKTTRDKSTRFCINFQYNKCTRGDAWMFRHVCSAPTCGAEHDNQSVKVNKEQGN